MKIISVFDAVKEGQFDEFKKLYDGNINQVNTFTQLNLLETAVLNSKNAGERLEIIKFLIEHGIDVNFQDSKFQRNALHTLFFNFLRGDVKFLLEVTKLLVDAGSEINAVDKYNAIPLKYTITICKLKTESIKEVYIYLLKSGADYMLKDSFEKSCIDYANELSWRSDFINIIKEVESDKQ